MRHAHRTPRTLYFMRQRGTMGPVKIGCSTYLPDRLDELSVWSPVELELAAHMPGGFKDERRLHWAFADHHSHHEWFHWSPALERVIRAVRDGSFSWDEFPIAPRGRPIAATNGRVPGALRLVRTMAEVSGRSTELPSPEQAAAA